MPDRVGQNYRSPSAGRAAVLSAAAAVIAAGWVAEPGGSGLRAPGAALGAEAEADGQSGAGQAGIGAARHRGLITVAGCRHDRKNAELGTADPIAPSAMSDTSVVRGCRGVLSIDLARAYP
jgi:hypothetical protein